jgi:capsular exopolysaccharide synthesis family protein
MDWTLRDALKVIFRHKWIILVCVSTAMVVLYVVKQMRTPMYEAEVKMLITAAKQIQSPFYKEVGGNNKAEIALTQSEIVKSDTVIQRVIRQFEMFIHPLDYEMQFASPLRRYMIERHIKNFKEGVRNLTLNQKQDLLLIKAVNTLKARVDVQLVRDTHMFTIRARDFDPQEAAKIANLISRSYIIFDIEQQLAETSQKYGYRHPNVIQLSDIIETMKSQLNTPHLANTDAFGQATVKIVQQAGVPQSSMNSIGRKTWIAVLIVALGFGVFLAFALEFLNQTIKSADDIEHHFQIPMIGFIRKRHWMNRNFLRDVHVQSQYAQSYQRLSEQLHLLFRDHRAKSILLAPVSSDRSGAIVTANLAKCFSDLLKHKVLVIDANFRRSALRKFWGLPKKKQGLSDLLHNGTSIEDVVIALNDRLSIIPSGHSDVSPVSLLDSKKLSDVLDECAEVYDVVLIHAPNALEFKDAAAITPYVDGVVFIVNEAKIRRQAIRNVMEPYKAYQAHLMGVILNNRKFALPDWIYEHV